MDQLYNFLMEQLHNNQFASAGILAGAGAILWQQARSIPTSIWARIHRLIHYQVVIEEKEELHKYITIVLLTNQPEKIKSAEAYLINDTILYSHRDDFIRIWYKRRRIRISSKREKIEGALNADNMYNRSYTISGLWAERQIKDLIVFYKEEGKKMYNDLITKKDYISMLYISPYDKATPVYKLRPKPFDQIYLDAKLKEDILADLEKFKTSKERYREKNVAYKRGYGFFGTPGNGKSSLAGAIAEYMKWDVYELDITRDVSNFHRIIARIPDNCVVTIEDFDSYYTGRKANEEKGAVPYSVLLNVLSGVGAKENVIFVVTTNHPETLDPALTRAGRLDFIRYLENPTEDVVNEYLSDYFETPVNETGYKSICFSEVQDIVMMSESLEEAIKALKAHS